MTLNDCNVEAETVCSGREFQVWAAATGKARLPTVASLTEGTTRRLVPAERRALRPGTSTVEVSGPRYSLCLCVVYLLVCVYEAVSSQTQRTHRKQTACVKLSASILIALRVLRLAGHHA